MIFFLTIFDTINIIKISNNIHSMKYIFVRKFYLYQIKILFLLIIIHLSNTKFVKLFAIYKKLYTF